MTTGAGAHHEVVIVGGGAGGIAAASGLLRRKPGLDIALIEPNDVHYYQPGWTLVGGGVFNAPFTARAMDQVIPKGVKRVRAAVASFAPDRNQVVLQDGAAVGYKILIVAPGIKLNWDGVQGLRETLGKNGVTSNYSYETAPCTWRLVQDLKEGVALFTQPPMPIKCAGAPQKSMYLSCDHWMKQGRLPNIKVEFHNAGAVLFGVAAYVPALMSYVKKYGIDLCFESKLIAVDGPGKVATFLDKQADGGSKEVSRSFDMIHVCPPQTAPDFIAHSPLADEAGYVAVSQESLQHTRYENVFGLGDGCSAPNAKTAAAVRKQAPVVAENVMAFMAGRPLRAVYDGYGSCPLTVERGKIVLAEFGYGGKLLPTFPTWLVEGTEPTRLAWFLKEKMLPTIYWQLLLKGHEWLAKPIMKP